MNQWPVLGFHRINHLWGERLFKHVMMTHQNWIIAIPVQLSVFYVFLFIDCLKYFWFGGFRSKHNCWNFYFRLPNKVTTLLLWKFKLILFESILNLFESILCIFFSPWTTFFFIKCTGILSDQKSLPNGVSEDLLLQVFISDSLFIPC